MLLFRYYLRQQSFKKKQRLRSVNPLNFHILSLTPRSPQITKISGVRSASLVSKGALSGHHFRRELITYELWYELGHPKSCHIITSFVWSTQGIFKHWGLKANSAGLRLPTDRFDSTHTHVF